MKLLQKLQSIGYLRTLDINTYTMYTKDNKNNVTRHKYKLRKNSDKLLVLGFLEKKKLVFGQGLRVLVLGIIELDFKFRRNIQRVLYHGFSTGFRYKRRKYTWANTNSNGSLRLRNFFYIIKIINYLPAVIVVAVYYAIISPDVAEAKFIFCMFYQSKSSSSEGRGVFSMHARHALHALPIVI